MARRRKPNPSQADPLDVHRAHIWGSILDGVAESEGVDPESVEEYTPELLQEIKEFEEAAQHAVTDCAGQFPPTHEIVVNGSRAVDIYHTLSGDGVGIGEDRGWKKFYPDFSAKNWNDFIDCLEANLGRFVDSAGSGTLNHAFREAVLGGGDAFDEGEVDELDDLQEAIDAIQSRRRALWQPPLDLSGWSPDDVREFAQSVRGNPDAIDARSPFASWPTLKAAQRSTVESFGPDSGVFYFYTGGGDKPVWRRSIAYPRGGVVVDASPAVGRGVLRIDEALRRRTTPVPTSSFLTFQASPGFLYHLTTPAAYLGIRRTGLRAGAFPGLGTSSPEEDSGYEEHSADGVFLTDAAGLPYWLNNQMTKEAEHVLLRTPSRKCPVDPHGTKDARDYLGERTTSYKCAGPVRSDELEVWDVASGVWRPLDAVVVTHVGETILARNPVDRTFASLMAWR